GRLQCCGNSRRSRIHHRLRRLCVAPFCILPCIEAFFAASLCAQRAASRVGAFPERRATPVPEHAERSAQRTAPPGGISIARAALRLSLNTSPLPTNHHDADAPHPCLARRRHTAFGGARGRCAAWLESWRVG